LAELCTKRRWQAPTYNVTHESGPSHKKDFLYQVIVNGSSYQHNIVSNNKKLAKAEAAFAALKALGVVPVNAAMSL
jgi:dsRNA-specific ribonuclease